jgi:hypothetical protein
MGPFGLVGMEGCSPPKRGGGDQPVGYGRNIPISGIADANMAGLPASLASAADSDEFDKAIIASHLEAFDEVGLDVGTPVIRIRGKALFGPVITPIPRGEAAGELWDGVVLVTKADGFFELKRSRDRVPSFN